ncbi:MAG: protein kinase [Planctomycetota bacterium]
MSGDHHHPGVVGYRSSGVDLERRPYLVMDYAQGEPLSPRVTELAQSVDATVEVLAQCADAVQHLHQKGVLHRDLKPSNILLTRRGVVLGAGDHRPWHRPGPAARRDGWAPRGDG